MGLWSLSHHRSSSPSPVTPLLPVPSARSTVRNTVMTTLILLEKAVDGLNIPGLKGAAGSIVEIIKIAEKRAQNKAALDDLATYLCRLEDAMITPLLKKQSLGVSGDLEARVRRLAEELTTLGREWKALKISHKRFLSFFNHEDYTAEIARVNKLIKESLDAFSLESQLSAAIVAETTCQVVTRVERHLLTREIQCLPRANAAYDSISRSNAPRCFQGTRTLVFNLLKEWIGSQDGPRTCVLEGIAGVGKSTIAQTLAEEEARIQRLAATFIFSRDENDRNKADLFFTTIAYQLAQINKDFAERISTALQQFPDAPHKTLAEQLKKLIVEPLHDLPLSTSHPILIIIDAMDECEKEGATQIVQLLLAHLPFFKILITTRPEPHIRGVLDAHLAHKSLVLHEMDNTVVDEDIRRYLEYQLAEQEIRRAVPGCEWQLEKKDFDSLVEVAGHLFIVASTAVKFIKDDIQLNPQHQLNLLLGAFELEDNTDLSPHATLDQLYIQVLETAIPQTHAKHNIIQRFQNVVGTIVVLQDPLSAQTLVALIGMDLTSINAVLQRLQSVIVSGMKDQCPRVYHPSFLDFITTPSRCKEPRFLIEPSAHHGRVAGHCFNTMKRLLRRNICEIPLPDQYLENHKIPDLELKVAGHIPAELVYACSYWAIHLNKAQSGADVLLVQLEAFMYHYLLFWLEVLSLTGNVRLGYSALELAKEFVTSQGTSSKVISMLSDGQRFITASQEIIKASALHVYYSALPFTPSETTLFQAYKKETGYSIRVLLGQGKGWDPLLATLAGHFNEVSCIAISSDGKRLASGSEDLTVRLWDGTTGAHISTLGGHSKRISSIAFTSDGKRLASGSYDKTVRLWDGATGAAIATLKGHSYPVECIALTSDGKRLASGSHDNTVRLWDGKTGAHIATLKSHSDWIRCVAFTPDGRILASGSDDKTIRLWDGATGGHIKTLEGHSDCVSCITFTSDGKRLASGSSDKTVKLWDGPSGDHITTLEGHSGSISCIAVTSDGKRIASGSDDETVRLSDVITGEHITSLEGHSSWVNCIAFTSDDKCLASGAGNTVRLWDGKTGEYTTSLKGHSGQIFSLAFAPNGNRLASGSADNMVKLWDVVAGPETRAAEGHSDWIRCIEFSPDGKRLASGSSDRTVRLWDGVTGAHITVLEGHSDDVSCIAFTPNGTRLASGSDDRTVKLWDGTTGAYFVTLKGHSDLVWCVTFTPDGKYLASGSDDSTVRLWDGITGAAISTLPTNTSICSIQFSPDMTHLTAQLRDGELQVWDIEGDDDDEPQPSQFNHPPSSSPSSSSQPSLRLPLKGNNGIFTVVATIDRASEALPVCLLPFGASATRSTSVSGRIAVGMENGQLLFLDASQVRFS